MRTASNPSVPNLLILKQTVHSSLTISATNTWWPLAGVARAEVSLSVTQELSVTIAISITTSMEQLAQGGTYVTCLKLLFGKHSHNQKLVTNVLLPDGKRNLHLLPSVCVQLSKHTQHIACIKKGCFFFKCHCQGCVLIHLKTTQSWAFWVCS